MQEMFQWNQFFSRCFQTTCFIGFKVYTTMNQHRKIWKNLLYFFPAIFIKPVKIHLHPGRYSADQRHILINGFLNNLIQFGFPVFNAICFIRWAIDWFVNIRYMMIHNTTQPACWNIRQFFPVPVSRIRKIILPSAKVVLPVSAI